MFDEFFNDKREAEVLICKTLIAFTQKYPEFNLEDVLIKKVTGFDKRERIISLEFKLTAK